MKRNRAEVYRKAVEEASKVERARLMSAWKKTLVKDLAVVLKKTNDPLTLEFLDSQYLRSTDPLPIAGQYSVEYQGRLLNFEFRRPNFHFFVIPKTCKS